MIAQIAPTLVSIIAATMTTKIMGNSGKTSADAVTFCDFFFLMPTGDITWHHGWTLHSSPSNPRDEARTALAISYVRDGTRLLSDSVGLVYSGAC